MLNYFFLILKFVYKKLKTLYLIFVLKKIVFFCTFYFENICYNIEKKSK